MAEIKKSEFFIVSGQKAYIAEVGEEFRTGYDRRDSRLRVIFDNGTESDVLMRSLQRALRRDGAGRRVTELDAGPLFEGGPDPQGTESGTIYVLRSLSDHPDIVSAPRRHSQDRRHWRGRRVANRERETGRHVSSRRRGGGGDLHALQHQQIKA